MKACIFGVRDSSSIAWAIAKKFNQEGFQVAVGYQERYENQVKELAKELNNPLLKSCEVESDESIKEFFTFIQEKWSNFDILIHSIAFTKKKFLEGKYMDIDRVNFFKTLDISSFSFTALVKASVDLINENGLVLTLTYKGSTQFVDNYNIMGVAKAALESSVRYLANDLKEKNIRVNAISPEAIETTAAKAIKGFTPSNQTTEDVANKAFELIKNKENGKIIFL